METLIQVRVSFRRSEISSHESQADVGLIHKQGRQEGPGLL